VAQPDEKRTAFSLTKTKERLSYTFFAS